MPGQDHDHDGDVDQFDAQLQQLRDNPSSDPTVDQQLWADLNRNNAIWEWLQDFAELLDNDPSNDSFADGGLSQGDVEPDMTYWPDGSNGSGLPVVLTFDNVTYSFVGGNFSIIDVGGGGPGGGGGDPFGV